MEKEQETNRNEFFKIVKEFIPDLLTTFPEYKDDLDDGIISILRDEWESDDAINVYSYSKSVFPERFFDILYQNEEIFSDEELNTEFLPGLNFSDMWSVEGLTEKTKTVLWKYLQLLMFSLISDIKDGSMFKDTEKLFEAIDEDEFKNKLEETINGMQGIFTNNEEDSEQTGDVSNINLEGLPNPEDIHNHINGMLGGKLGNLAREIAEETAEELNVNMDDVSSVGDVFKTLFKNPAKLMGIVKNVGNKLESKIKSGEIDESELIKETTDMMGKMNNMPGMGNMKDMLDKFGMSGLSGMMGGLGGKNMKMNMGAFNNHMKGMQMRERMKKKVESKQQEKDCFDSENTIENTIRGEKKFQKGEAPERSVRVKKPIIESFEGSVMLSNEKKSKKKMEKKSKKKKSKK